ncbi:class I SAM-dependent methyltransferase [Propionivibrio soli]|uniref:class I SAM-dependent methyltransferase n=1 Tax=Propionivibrio soli TaxID=2976531 RepID=UPI0021E88598|nr:class I SAM-dependent methyltransferase [Propionivibrio soli]
MGFTLDKVVPWGRSYDEYVGMFDLSPRDLEQSILGCGDSPASFNATLTQRSGRVVSFDPVYAFDAAQIRGRIADTYEKVLEQLRQNQADYVWGMMRSVEEVGRVRLSAMENFLADFSAGKRDGRYVAGELPRLPFASDTFDLALSSHFLFLYSDHLSETFHLESLQEMLRVAREVRVFPLLTLDGRRSPHLDSMIDELGRSGFAVSTRRVAYEFQRGGNEMLVIRRAVEPVARESQEVAENCARTLA